MKISNIPPSLDKILTNSNLKQQNMCFMNCYLAVMNTISKPEFDLHYVLATVSNGEGERFAHALLKMGNKYYDPTLEPIGLHMACSYEIEREFSKMEIVDLLKRRFSMDHIQDMIYGRQPHWPLIRTGQNTYDFVDV